MSNSNYREWISPATVTYIINDFVENWEDQPDYIKNMDWYFMPVQNPDGYEYSHTRDRYWRKNRRRIGFFCNGVDLNRNYGHMWGGKGTSKRPCSEVYAGTGPFSEPETKAVRDFFMNSTSKFQGSLSFHSYGQYILYPWGFDSSVPDDHNDLKEAGNSAANVNSAQKFSFAKNSNFSVKYFFRLSNLYPTWNTLWALAVQLCIQLQGDPMIGLELL